MDYALTADGEEKARELYEKLSDKEKQALSSLKQRFGRADRSTGDLKARL